MQSKDSFRQELKRAVNQKLKEINHYIAGCDSPFSYIQIREAQDLMNDIREVLEIESGNRD